MGMTENESILSTLQNGIVCATDDITREDLEMMVKCLEELEQYRAIGTVEHIKLTFELCNGLDCMVKMYESIGTIEELQALKEKNEPAKVIEYNTTHFVHWQCGNCGAEFYSGQLFCDDCGHPADWGDLLK
jgi:predicted nucleic-acid-binding Zn-ribbon protein